MAKIEDLIERIPDESLRKAIAGEVKILKKTKKFGLVFEEHLPETVRLPLLPVRQGELVALKREAGNRLWKVKAVRKLHARCEKVGNGGPDQGNGEKEFEIEELVVVRNFGDPIYPALVPVDRVQRGGDKPWHMLVSADNFHALQLLLYAHEGKVDVIYIDPPYNTGARDWKYNNDYVDKADSWRHSKWLSMLKKRLLLAKRLLKPDGVLIVTIDEHEVHHLGVLLEEKELLREYGRQMVTIVINEKGVAQDRLSRAEEHALFCFGPKAEISPQSDDLLSIDLKQTGPSRAPRWERLLRGGPGARRSESPKLFYPIFVDPRVPKIIKVGEPLPLGQEPTLPDDMSVAWPLRTDGSQGRWRASPSTFRGYLDKGYAKLGGYDAGRKTWTILYLGRKARKQIDSGAIRIVARDNATGVVSLQFSAGEQRQIKTVWHRASHDSGNYGSSMLKAVLGEAGTFAYPKSLYAVRDTLNIVTSTRPDALIVDFFAGSGTTFHATALLNSETGGRRRCILVTNNEVTEKNEKALAEKGRFPGDPEFERHGVAEAVAWPRCKWSVLGHRDDGSMLEGDYLTGRHLQEGFEENLEYFRLAFLDPAQVARGDAFQAVLPILWMIAGCRGQREESKGSQAWFIPKDSPFAVLIKEKEFRAFRNKLSERKDIRHVFLITDSEENFAAMRRALGRKLSCVQLYKSYLETFRLNTQETLG